jgi:hypothetical protein
MFKSIRLRILAVITIFLVSAMSTYTYAEGLLKKSDNNPSVHATKTFLIYAKKGNFKVFDFSGKLVKNEVSKDFRNGELLFIITGPKSAIFSANTGISEVGFIKDTNSVTFIETTPAGNKHVMIIEDKWDAKESGFKFTYTRNIQMLGKNMRSVYTGIAKPTLHYKRSRKPNHANPSLQNTKTFSIFAQEGNFKAFNLESGKLVEKDTSKSFRNGEIIFMITGPDSAIMSGNLGSADVELVKDHNFLTFIETTPLGGKHIMVIANEWDAKSKGFKFTYIRNTIDKFLSGVLMRSIYSGIAKPTLN